MANHFIPLEGVSGSVSVVLSVEVAPAARGEYRLRLWDDYGRNPKDVTGMEKFTGTIELPVTLGEAGELRGRTLTWSVRLAPPAHAGNAEYRASIRIKTDKGEALHAMEYSGPLEDIHEIAGQFHFEPAKAKA